jgi:nucleotidyltransferase DUF2204
MPLSKDLREFVELLNANKVEYVVVGAFAVAFYGVPRYTADLDLLVRPTKANGERILSTLRQFGFGDVQIEPSDFSGPDKIVQLGVSPNRVDLLTSITGVSFEEVWSTRKNGDLDGITVSFIGPSSLIKNKEQTGRPRDLGDADELKKRYSK